MTIHLSRRFVDCRLLRGDLRFLAAHLGLQPFELQLDGGEPRRLLSGAHRLLQQHVALDLVDLMVFEAFDLVDPADLLLVCRWFILDVIWLERPEPFEGRRRRATCHVVVWLRDRVGG